jgi:predicted dehydrogenase
MMKRLAIAGLGRWGRILVDSVQGRSDKAGFTHAVVRTPDKARDYAAHNGLTLTTDMAAVLADPAVDGVVLATPHSQHAEQVIAAAAAGKHIFCEKPFTLTKADAVRAVDAANAAGVVLAVGHNRRFLPAVRALKAMIEAGELGRILNIEGNMSGHVGARYTADMWRVDARESPAGGMAGSGIHIIDTMIHLIGPISEVQAQSYRLVNEIPFDDTTSMLFRFANGSAGYLVAMTATAPTLRLQVFGDKAAAELRGENRLEFVPVEGPKVIREWPAFDMERAQLEAFADAIDGRSPFPVPLNEVIDGIAAFEAVPLSAADHARRQVG